jgi:hypothetical protein
MLHQPTPASTTQLTDPAPLLCCCLSLLKSTQSISTFSPFCASHGFHVRAGIVFVYDALMTTVANRVFLFLRAVVVGTLFTAARASPSSIAGSHEFLFFMSQ